MTTSFTEHFKLCTKEHLRWTHMVFWHGEMGTMETGVIVHCGAKLELMGIVVTFWAMVCRGSELKSKINRTG
jgi:hypothetical protein